MQPSRFGTRDEPVYVFRDVFKDKGKKIKNIMVECFKKKGAKLPKPSGKEHWRSWKSGVYLQPEKLRSKAKELLRYLRKHHLYKHDRHMCHEPHRGFNAKDINISQQSGQGWHQDAQDYGRLLFLFVAGNTSKNVIRLGGWNSTHMMEIMLKSGDCAVFEGQTWHKVDGILENTSPFKDKSDWLCNRRISILVRQKGANKPLKRLPWLKKDVPKQKVAHKFVKKTSFGKNAKKASKK